MSSEKGRLCATKTSKRCSGFCGMSCGPWVLGMRSKWSDSAQPSRKIILLWVLFLGFSTETGVCFCFVFFWLCGPCVFFLWLLVSLVDFHLRCSQNNFFLGLVIWATSFLAILDKIVLNYFSSRQCLPHEFYHTCGCTWLLSSTQGKLYNCLLRQEPSYSSH